MLAIRRTARLKVLRFVVWSVIAALLLAPLAAMQLSNEVSWTAGDFAVAAALLALIGLSFEAIMRSPLRAAVNPS